MVNEKELKKVFDTGYTINDGWKKLADYINNGQKTVKPKPTAKPSNGDPAHLPDPWFDRLEWFLTGIVCIFVFICLFLG